MLALAVTLISGFDYFYRFFREESARRNKDNKQKALSSNDINYLNKLNDLF